MDILLVRSVHSANRDGEATKYLVVLLTLIKFRFDIFCDSELYYWQSAAK